MTALEALHHVRRAGRDVVFTDAGKLRLTPGGKLPGGVVAALKEHRDELAAHLLTESEPDEIEGVPRATLAMARAQQGQLALWTEKTPEERAKFMASPLGLFNVQKTVKPGKSPGCTHTETKATRRANAPGER